MKLPEKSSELPPLPDPSAPEEKDYDRVEVKPRQLRHEKRELRPPAQLAFSCPVCGAMLTAENEDAPSSSGVECERCSTLVLPPKVARIRKGPRSERSPLSMNKTGIPAPLHPGRRLKKIGD